MSSLIQYKPKYDQISHGHICNWKHSPSPSTSSQNFLKVSNPLLFLVSSSFPLVLSLIRCPALRPPRSPNFTNTSEPARAAPPWTRRSCARSAGDGAPGRTLLFVCLAFFRSAPSSRCAGRRGVIRDAPTDEFKSSSPALFSHLRKTPRNVSIRRSDSADLTAAARNL